MTGSSEMHRCLARYALDLHSHGHLDRSISLGHLAQNHYEQFTLFGGIEHINEAVVLDRDALARRPRPDIFPGQACNDLEVRYHQLGTSTRRLSLIKRHWDFIHQCTLIGK